MALSVNAPGIVESSKEDIDLEDGEIEDDEEEVVKTPTPVVVEKVVPPKKSSPAKLEPPIIDASAVDSAKLLVTKSKEPKIKEPKVKESKIKDPKKHSKKHSSRSTKLNQKHFEPPKPKQNIEAEDDWADNVEKAIRAVMGSDRNAVVEGRPSREEKKTHDSVAEIGVEGDENAELSGEEKKSRKKKRKKKHRDEDGDERKESKRRKKHHHKEEEMEEGMDGEDDDEMLFVRGASPIWRSERQGSQSPPGYHDDPYLYPDDGQFDELYDSYEDDSELDDYLHEADESSRRGRGIKRRGRGGMRGMGRKGLRPRDALALKKRKRMLLQRHPEQRPDSVCMFFMQGKCQKGDDCPYSHDALPPRKMELCKFYLMDCCAKKDKCLYMHHDFPCKFHHTGLKCYAGDRCKFSHGNLSDVLKNILLRHLETAPKEILGDFPRLSREGAAAMVHNKKSRDFTSTSSTAAASAAKAIPSLFDIEVPVPLQFMPEKDGDQSPTRKTTPMPSDNEDQDINNESSPPPKSELRSPSKRHKNRWDNGDETNKKTSRFDLDRHDENKHHWDEEIRKQQQQHEQQQHHQQQQQQQQQQQHDNDNNRWDNENKQRDDSEKKKRRGDKEKKPRWEDGKESKESHSRRRGDSRDDEKRKWESDERRSKKRSSKEKSMFANAEAFGEDEDLREPKSSYKDQGFREQLDQLKPMMRCYKDSTEENSTQSQRLLRLAGYSGSPSNRHTDNTPKPLDLDTDAEDKDDLVMDIDDNETGRKESVDEAALVIDTHEDECEKEREEENKEADNMGMSTEEGRESPVIPLHIQKLPKKQQELFLRIQQQQREQQINQGASAHEEKDEDQQDESWYSSDDDDTGETSLSDVLKKLSASKVSQPDPDLAKKVTDLTKVPDVSDAVNKLLSSIGMRTQPEEKTDRPKTGTTLPILPLPPLPLPQPTMGPRDPRLSRDPRKRQESNDTRTSQDSPTPGSSSSSSSRVDPRSRRRSSTSRSIYDSISLSGPDKPSESTLGRGDTDLRGFLTKPRDVDLRPSSKDMDLRVGYGDLDLRVNTDSRGMSSMISPLASSILTAKSDMEGGGDIDLRRMLGGLPFKPVPQHTAATEIDASLNSHRPIPYKLAVVTIPVPDYSRLKLSSTDQLVRADPRLRKLFKISSSSPASPPLVASSLTSPTPSGSGSNPPSRADPRRLASQSRSAIPDAQEQNQTDSHYQHRNNEIMNNDQFSMQNTKLINQQSQFVRNELLANPMLLQQILPNMGLQSPQGMHALQNIDPRMFRSAPQTPGLLGDAPFYPNMPHYDEMERDNSNGSDTDLRTFYQGNKRMGNSMEMQEWEQQQMIDDQQHHSSYRNNNNRNNWRGNPRRRNNNRQYEKGNRSNRSYTPPQM